LVTCGQTGFFAKLFQEHRSRDKRACLSPLGTPPPPHSTSMLLKGGIAEVDPNLLPFFLLHFIPPFPSLASRRFHVTKLGFFQGDRPRRLPVVARRRPWFPELVDFLSTPTYPPTGKGHDILVYCVLPLASSPFAVVYPRVKNPSGFEEDSHRQSPIFECGFPWVRFACLRYPRFKRFTWAFRFIFSGHSPPF